MLDSAAPPPLSRKPGFFRRHAVKFVASALITGALLYTLKKAGLQLWPPASAFSQVKWWTVPAYIVTFIAVSYFRATRWRFLLRSFADVPLRKVITASWVGFAAILIFPFRMGEVVRPYMVREKGKVSLTRATGSVVGERVVDGLFLTVVLAIALLLVPTRNPLDQRIPGLPTVTVGYVRHASFVMLGFFAAVFACIALFYFARSFAEKLTHWTLGLVSKKLANKVAETAIKLGEGLHFLGRARDAVPFLAETAAYWGLNALGMWLLAYGCGVTHADGTELTFLEACALMGTLGVTILIPGPPFLLGTFQAGIIAGLGMYCSAETLAGPGIAYASLMFALQFAWTIVSGGVSLLGGGKSAALSALEDEAPPASAVAASD